MRACRRGRRRSAHAAASFAIRQRATEPVEPRCARLAQHPSTGARPPRRAAASSGVRRRRPRARCRRRPRRPSARRPARARRPTPRSADGRTETRPRCGPSGHAGAPASSVAPATRLRSAATSAATPSSSTWRARAVPRQARRPEQATTHRERVGVGDEPLRGGGHRLAAQRDLHQHADRAERSDEQAREVEAADVLHRRTSALHDAAVDGDEPHLEHAVAQRSVAEAAVARQAGGQEPADGGVGVAGIERALLALRRQHRGELAARGAGPHGDGEVGGVVGDDPGRCAHERDVVARRCGSADAPSGCGCRPARRPAPRPPPRTAPRRR